MSFSLINYPSASFDSLKVNNLVVKNITATNISSNSFLTPFQFQGFLDPLFTNTNLATTTSLINYWAGGVLAPNGKIYMAPNNSPSVLVYDPLTKLIEYVNISA